MGLRLVILPRFLLETWSFSDSWKSILLKKKIEVLLFSLGLVLINRWRGYKNQMPLHSPSTFVVRAALAFEFVQYFNSTWCVIDTGFFEMLLEICRSWHKLKNETKKHFGFFLTAVPEFRTPCATACPGRIQRRGKEMVGVGRGCGGGVWGRVWWRRKLLRKLSPLTSRRTRSAGIVLLN